MKRYQLRQGKLREDLDGKWVRAAEALDEKERLQRERDELEKKNAIQRDTLVGLNILERGTREEASDYVRQQFRLALDRHDWLDADTKRWDQEQQVYVIQCAEVERLQVIVSLLPDWEAELIQAQNQLHGIRHAGMAKQAVAYVEKCIRKAINDAESIAETTPPTEGE